MVFDAYSVPTVGRRRRPAVRGDCRARSLP